MASSSDGSKQTPPPSPPPPPMTSQEDNQSPGQATAKEGEARGKGKAKSSKRELESVEVFDKLYNKKGKVLAFPDFVQHKVTLYKRVTPARPPPPADAATDPQASREQRSPSTATENSVGQTSDVAKDSQQLGQQEKATDSEENLDGSSQDKKTAAESQIFSSEGNVEASSCGEGGDGSETKTKKIRRKDPPSFVLDAKKLKDPNILERLDAEDCEFLLVQHIKAALEEIADPDDPPVFLLHNQNLSSKAASSKSGEKDVLVLHPHLGVLLLEVKAVKNKDAFSRFDEATAQLLHAKESIQKEMEDLLEKDAVVLAITLPKLEPEDSCDIRQKAQERLSPKQGSDITAATSTSSMRSFTAPTRDKKSGKKSEGVKRDCGPKVKEGALLGDHPEIHLVCGSTAEVITQWVRRLQHLRATASHTFKGSTVEERVESFKKACIRRCSVAGLRPGQSVKASADLHHRFLLTEEQLHVRDSQAELLHISGPFGSGKTLLLAERARRWLREGRRRSLAVGGVFQNVLLCHLSESVCGEKTDVARVSTHSSDIDLLEWLQTVSTEDPVSIIVDEARFSLNPSHYSSLLDHAIAGRISGLWTAHTTPLSDKDESKLRILGGSTVQLSHCLRCPPHVIAWTNSVRGKDDPPLLPPSIPVTRELGVGVEVISHDDHRHSQSWRTCPRCREEVRAFFSSLGLHGQHATSALSLSDVVVLTTVDSCDRQHVAAWLCSLGVHAVAEETWRYVTTPVLPPGVAPISPDFAEREAVRQRVLKGKDVEGSPAVQVLWCFHFQGLERKVVLLWHEDWRDEDRVRQTQKDWEDRMSWHRRDWLRAASRCQGRLAAMVTTPSPVLSLLPATSSPKSSAATASSNSPVRSASHHSPVSSSSLGGESNPQPPVRPSGRSSTKAARQILKSNPRPSTQPEWEIIYQRFQREPEIEPPTLQSMYNHCLFPQKSSAATASSNSPVRSASHHSPVSSSSLGGESNPQPPVRPSGRSSTKDARQDLKTNPRPSTQPEWEIIYQRFQRELEIEPPTLQST